MSTEKDPVVVQFEREFRFLEILVEFLKMNVALLGGLISRVEISQIEVATTGDLDNLDGLMAVFKAELEAILRLQALFETTVDCLPEGSKETGNKLLAEHLGELEQVAKTFQSYVSRLGKIRNTPRT